MPQKCFPHQQMPNNQATNQNNSTVNLASFEAIAIGASGSIRRQT
ncbi:hypothetical protein [Gloeocapsopsis dulcis]|nr:hypothetical protein [Gloeocapsopsis dulcis]